MSAPTSPSAAPERDTSESGLHDGSKPGRYADLSEGETQTVQGTPSAMQRLIGMLSSVKDSASGEEKANGIRAPSPSAQRLIKQLLVTLDEDAVRSKREGVGETFDELDGEAETLIDDGIGRNIANVATHTKPQKLGDGAAQARRRAHVERMRNIAVENRSKASRTTTAAM